VRNDYNYLLCKPFLRPGHRVNMVTLLRGHNAMSWNNLARRDQRNIYNPQLNSQYHVR